MKTKVMLVSADGGVIKSVPLNSLPQEAWINLTGDADASSDALARYEDIPWLYRGVEAICNAVVGMPHAIHRGGEDGPEIDEAALPFEIENGLENLLDNFARMLTLRGAAYAALERNRVRVLRVRPLHPGSIVPQYDAQRGVIGFERRVEGQVIRYAPEEIVYAWLPPTRKEIGPGTPPVVAALKAAGVLHHIDVFGEKYFENGGIMPTVIEMAEDTQDTDVARMQAWAERVMSGIKNAFRLTAVAGAVKAHTLGHSMKELVVPELTASKREDVATALGVPQTLLFSNAANYATAAQDDLHFYDKTIRPLDKRIVAALNRQLFEPMGLYLQTHPEQMEIYQRQEMTKAYSMAQLFAVGAIPVEYLWDVLSMPAQYRRGGTYYQRDTVVTGVPKPEEQEPLETPDQEELKQWRRMALKRIKEGKPEKAASFDSAHIAPTLAAAIRGSLAKATTVARAQAVFADALAWQEYP